MLYCTPKRYVVFLVVSTYHVGYHDELKILSHRYKQPKHRQIHVIRRKSTTSTTTAKKAPGGGSSAAGMWRFYTEDSPGIKV